MINKRVDILLFTLFFISLQKKKDMDNNILKYYANNIEEVDNFKNNFIKRIKQEYGNQFNFNINQIEEFIKIAYCSAKIN